MGEQRIIQETPWPRTRESLGRDLRSLGVEAGMTLLVHSSLSSLGWITGGPVTVVQALMDVITPAGTIVMPTHSSGYSDPAKWENPPVPQSWWQVIYDTMPAFDPQITPTAFMGQIVETFRTWPMVVRSAHPTVSFAAWGQHAEQITAGHSLDYSLGEKSPLARIYDLYGWILLLGGGYERCTSFHLAEYRAPYSRQTMEGSPMLEDEKRVWKTYQDIVLDSDLFPEIGSEFERTGLVKVARVGSAEAKLLPQHPAVDFATQWLTHKRTQGEERD